MAIHTRENGWTWWARFVTACVMCRTLAHLGMSSDNAFCVAVESVCVAVESFCVAVEFFQEVLTESVEYGGCDTVVRGHPPPFDGAVTVPK